MRKTLVKSSAETRVTWVGGKDEDDVRLVHKTKKSGGETPYYDKKNIAHPFLATIEAVSAHLMRLIFGPEFTPKGRVYQVVTPQKTEMHFLSKSIGRFVPAYNLHSVVIDNFLPQRKGELSKILLTVLCFQEPDLHARNWGFDFAKEEICHFDHDRKWALFSDSLSGGAHYGTKTLDDSELSQWPNLIYNACDAFGIISADDILNLSVFNNLKPFNDPFARYRTDPNENAKIEALSIDPYFRQKMFYRLTKFLLLPTSNRVRSLIDVHSPDPASPFIDGFFNTIMAHQARIKKALLFMPEYHQFLETNKTYIRYNLRNDIRVYNEEFSDADKCIKPDKAEYTVQEKGIGEVFEALRKLKSEVKTAVTNDTDAAREERAEDIAIACLVRDVVARENVRQILNNEIKRQCYAAKFCADFRATGAKGQPFLNFFDITDTSYAQYEEFSVLFFNGDKNNSLCAIQFLELISLGVPYKAFFKLTSAVNKFVHFITPFRNKTVETIDKKLEEKREQFTQNIRTLTEQLFSGNNAKRVKLKMMRILRERNIPNELLWGTVLPDHIRPMSAPAPVGLGSIMSERHYCMWKQRKVEGLLIDGNSNAANVRQVPGMFGN